jgi:hypothetical protein
MAGKSETFCAQSVTTIDSHFADANQAVRRCVVQGRGVDPPPV